MSAVLALAALSTLVAVVTVVTRRVCYAAGEGGEVSVCGEGSTTFREATARETAAGNAGESRETSGLLTTLETRGSGREASRNSSTGLSTVLSLSSMVTVVTSRFGDTARETREVTITWEGSLAALMSTLSTKDTGAGGSRSVRVEATSGVCETTVVSTVTVTLTTRPTKTSSRARGTTLEVGREVGRDTGRESPRERLSRAQAGDGKGESNAGKRNHLDLLLLK